VNEISDEEIIDTKPHVTPDISNMSMSTLSVSHDQVYHQFKPSQDKEVLCSTLSPKAGKADDDQLKYVPNSSEKGEHIKQEYTMIGAV
jgi:hypothetical protein